MKAAEVKLAIMQILLPYYDMFQSGEMADNIIKEFKETGRTNFYFHASKSKVVEVILTTKKS